MTFKGIKAMQLHVIDPQFFSASRYEVAPSASMYAYFREVNILLLFGDWR